MTFVILTGGIDLSVGSVVALSTMIAAATLRAGWPAWLVIIAVLATGAVLGLGMGVMIHRFGVQPFIATLAGHVPRARAVLRDQRGVGVHQGAARSATSRPAPSSCPAR